MYIKDNHTRIRLANNDDDYIDASKIACSIIISKLNERQESKRTHTSVLFDEFDSDPKCKYVATQGPMPDTADTSWQMIWKRRSYVSVALTRPSIMNTITMCHHYWLLEGSE